MKKIIFVLSYVITIVVTAVITSSFIAFRNTSKMKIVVDPIYIETRLFAENEKREYNDEKGNWLIEAIFKNIINTYFNQDNILTGLQFVNDSYYQGFAKLKYVNSKLIGFDFYSIYDTDLYTNFFPTSQINIYVLNNKTLIVDYFDKKLYEYDGKKNLKEIVVK